MNSENEASQDLDKTPTSDNAHLLHDSGLFDFQYYAQQLGEALDEEEAIKHYLANGAANKLSPSEQFDASCYLSTYPDIEKAGFNPLLHYLKFGRQEGRTAAKHGQSSQTNTQKDEEVQRWALSTGLFDEEFYLSRYESVRQSHYSAWEHYVLFGGQEGRQPSAFFDGKFYLGLTKPAGEKFKTPLHHYHEAGYDQGVPPKAALEFASGDILSNLSVEEIKHLIELLQRHEDEAKQQNWLNAGEAMRALVTRMPDKAEYFYNRHSDFYKKYHKPVQYRVPNINNRSRDMQFLQLLLLSGKYTTFFEWMQRYQAVIGAALTDTERNYFACLSCEAGLMTKDLALVSQGLKEFTPIAIESNYYLGRLALLEDDLEQAERELHYVWKVTQRPEAGYFLAQAFQLQGDKASAERILNRVLNQSRRASTWQWASALVASSADYLRLDETLENWSSATPNSRHHRDIALAMAESALRAGHGTLAKKIMHDAVLHHQQRKGGAPSVLTGATRTWQGPSTPVWLMPFASLPEHAFKPSSVRLKQAFTALVSQNVQWGCDLFPVNETSVWLRAEAREDSNQITPPNELEFCAPSEATWNLQWQYYSRSAEFLEIRADDNGLYGKWLNGIDIAILKPRQEGESVRFVRHGVVFSLTSTLEEITFEDVSVKVPTSGTSQRIENVPLALTATEQQIVDRHHYSVYAYKQLLDANIYSDETLEKYAIKALRRQNEQMAEYQRVLSTNEIVPTTEDIASEGIKVVLYVSGLEKVGYQANMWIPVLERLSVPTAIVIREKRIAEEIDATSLPIYYIKDMRNLEVLELGGVKTILYPGNSQKATQSLRLHRLNHYFVNHGESDKVVNQSKFLMAYDKLLVAGPMAERRLREANLPLRDNQVVHVGRPQVELLLDQVDAPTTEIKRILYAPTWEGFVEEANYCSVSQLGYNLLKILAEHTEIKIIFKPHPFTGYNKAGECGYYLDKMIQLCDAKDNLEYADSSKGIHHYMNESDMLITDISSVLNEYLYTRKPIVLCSVQNHDSLSLETEFPSSKAAYVLQQSQDMLGIMQAISSGDNKFSTRKVTCRDSLGEFSEGYMKRFDSIVCDF